MPERNRRADILHSAGVLFSQRGYHATTIRHIAQMSGVLSGSLYAHIRSKEDLLYEITDSVADQFLYGVAPVVAADAPPEQKFRLALAAHVAVVARNLEAATVFSQEWRSLTGERRQSIQRKRDQYEQLWADLLWQGAQAGVFSLRSPRLSRVVALSVANWLYQWYRPDGSLSAAELAQELAEELLDGLRVRTGAAGQWGGDRDGADGATTD